MMLAMRFLSLSDITEAMVQIYERIDGGGLDGFGSGAWRRSV